jgi:hypothetical protein
VQPRESTLSRPAAMRLAAPEYERCAEMFRSLSPAQWDFELTLTGPAGGTWTAGATARAGRWTPWTSAGPRPGARPASRSTS